MPENKPVSAKPRSSVSMGRVLLIVVPILLIVLVVGGLYAWYGETLFTGLFQPKVVEAKGKVIWNGNPVEGALLNTLHEDKTKRGASAFVGRGGTFELETMVNGEVRKGAFVGKHKVIIKQNDRSVPPGPFQPPPANPEKYLSFDTTDLVIEVTTDPEQNNFTLTMEGVGPKGQDNSKPVEGPETQTTEQPAEVNPAELAQQLMDRADEDKDGKLSADEQPGVGFTYGRGIIYADTNDDGFVDLEELKTMVTPANQRTEGATDATDPDADASNATDDGASATPDDGSATDSGDGNADDTGGAEDSETTTEEPPQP